MKNLERFNENYSSLDKDLANTSFKDDLKTVKQVLTNLSDVQLNISSSIVENLAKLNSEEKTFNMRV